MVYSRPRMTAMYLKIDGQNEHIKKRGYQGSYKPNCMLLTRNSP